ncbi:MAG: PAS domain S-box protein [bacterium]|nr:PAS domain S-box protein [bacterium]
MNLTTAKSLFDHIPELAAIYDDSNGEIVYINPAGAAVLGIEKRARQKNKSLMDIVDPSSRDSIAERIGAAVLEKEPTHSLEVLLRGINDKQVRAGISINCISFGKKTCLVLVARNISALINTDVFYSDGEAPWKNMMVSLPEPVCIHIENRIVYMNPAALSLSGYAEDYIIGKNIYDFVTSGIAGVIEKNIRSILLHKKTGIVPEVPILMSGGSSLLCEVTSSYIEYKGEPAVLSVGRDVTEERRTREKLLESVMSLLSIKEKEYLLWMAAGFNRKEISKQMGILLETGDTYKRRIKRKLKGEKEVEYVAKQVTLLLSVNNTLPERPARNAVVT